MTICKKYIEQFNKDFEILSKLPPEEWRERVRQLIHDICEEYEIQ